MEDVWMEEGEEDEEGDEGEKDGGKENRVPGLGCGLCGWSGEGASLALRVAHSKKCAARAAKSAASAASSAFLTRAFPATGGVFRAGEAIVEKCPGGTSTAFGRLLAGAVDSRGVRDLLRASGMDSSEIGRVTEAMARERVGMLEARVLAESDWIDLGVARLGPRRKLMAACAAMALRMESEGGGDEDLDRDVASKVEETVRRGSRQGPVGCARCGISLEGRSRVQKERHEASCGRKRGEQSCPHCGLDVSGKTLKWTISHTGRCGQAVAGAKGNVERRQRLIGGGAQQPTLAEVLQGGGGLQVGDEAPGDIPPEDKSPQKTVQTTLRFGGGPSAGGGTGDVPPVHNKTFGELVASAAAANDVEAFLQALGQTQLVDTFRKHKVDLAALRHLTDADLRWKLEVKELGPRRAILAALGRKPDTSTYRRTGVQLAAEFGVDAAEEREVIVVEDNAEEDEADEARRAEIAAEAADRANVASPEAWGVLSDHGVQETSSSSDEEDEDEEKQAGREPASKRRASMSRGREGLWAPGGLYDLARCAPAQFEGFDDRDSFIQRRLDLPEAPVPLDPVAEDGAERERTAEVREIRDEHQEGVLLVSDSSQSKGSPCPPEEPLLTTQTCADDGAGPAPTPSPGMNPSGCSPESGEKRTLALEDLIGPTHPPSMQPPAQKDNSPGPGPGPGPGPVHDQVGGDVWVLSDSDSGNGRGEAERETPLSALKRRRRRRSSASSMAGLSPGARVSRLRQHYDALVAAQEAIRAQATLEIERLREDEAKAVAQVLDSGGTGQRERLTATSGSLGDELPDGPDLGFVPASQAVAPQGADDMVQGSSSESESDVDDPGYVISSQMVGACPLPEKPPKSKPAAKKPAMRRLAGGALDRAVCTAIRADPWLWERCLVLEAIRAEDVVRVAADAGVRVGKAAAARILVDQGVAVQP